jgi:hypothetical protein
MERKRRKRKRRKRRKKARSTSPLFISLHLPLLLTSDKERRE